MQKLVDRILELISVRRDITTTEHFPTEMLLASGDLTFSLQNQMECRLQLEIDRLDFTDAGRKLFEEMSFQEDQTETSPKPKFRSEQCVRNTLFSPYTSQLMFTLWCRSPFVTSEEISAVRFSRASHDRQKSLTQNGLATQVVKSMKLDISRARSQINIMGRMCDAMRIYGLVERCEDVKNYMPISATKRLDRLMRASLSEPTKIILDQMKQYSETRDDQG